MGFTDNVLSDILEIETTARGYIISSDEKFLENMDAKFSQLLSDITAVQTLTVDNQRTQHILSQLVPLIHNRIRDFKEDIKFKKENKLLKDSEIKVTIYEQSETNKIKLLINEIYEGEVSLLQKREEDTRRDFNTTVYLTCVATIISIMFLICILVLFNRLLSRLKDASIQTEIQFSEAEKHSKDMSLISEMNNLLASSSSIKETLNIISLYLKKLLPFTAGTVYLMKSSANYLEDIMEWNNPRIREKVFMPIQCWALRQGKIHTFFNKDDDVPCEHVQLKIEGLSCICAPMLAQNEIIGVLYLEILPSAGKTQQQIKTTIAQNFSMIQNLAGQIALSISNIRLHEVMKTRSTRDPLTNLYNRSYLAETLDRDLQRAKRQNISIAIIMMDIDFFKNVNDKYGHDAGDAVLKQIAKLLIDNIRQSDIVCRYGGEEFLLAFYDTDLETAKQRVEQIRTAIYESKFDFQGFKYSASASFGIAMYPDHGYEDADKLIKAADEALYESKQTGRNKFTVYHKPA